MENVEEHIFRFRYKIYFWIRSLLRTALAEHTKHSNHESTCLQGLGVQGCKVNDKVYINDIIRMIIIEAQDRAKALELSPKVFKLRVINCFIKNQLKIFYKSLKDLRDNI